MVGKTKVGGLYNKLILEEKVEEFLPHIFIYQMQTECNKIELPLYKLYEFPKVIIGINPNMFEMVKKNEDWIQIRSLVTKNCYDLIIKGSKEDKSSLPLIYNKKINKPTDEIENSKSYYQKCECESLDYAEYYRVQKKVNENNWIAEKFADITNE